MLEWRINIFSTNVTFPQEIIYILRWEPRPKKIKKNIYFKNCTFYLGEGHICVDDAKTRKMKKNEKSWKKCQNGLKSRIVPQVPQNKWFGEGTKRAFPRWCQFLIKTLWKLTLSIFKFWWENHMKLRILVFMNNDFSDRFWQKHTFCCMICTIFLKVCR